MSHSQEVQQKLEQLKTYVPFVKRMINKLESKSSSDKSGHIDKLDKLKGLHKFLTNPDCRVQNIEMLDRMEKIVKGLVKTVGKISSTTSQSKPEIDPSEKCEKKKDSKELGKRESHEDGRDSRSSHSHHSRNRRDSRDSRDSQYIYGSKDKIGHSSRERDDRHRSRNYDERHRHRDSRDRDDRHRYKDKDERCRSRRTERDHERSSSMSQNNNTSTLLSSSDQDYRKFPFSNCKPESSESDAKEYESKSSNKSSEQNLFDDDGCHNRGPERSKHIKQSLLDLPMPPRLHNITLQPLNSRPYLEQQTSSEKSILLSNIDTIKNRIVCSEQGAKPARNMDEIKTRIGSINRQDDQASPLFAVSGSNRTTQQPHDNQYFEHRNPHVPANIISHDLLSPMQSNTSPTRYRSVTSYLKPKDKPLPSYPHVPPSVMEPSQSPENEASFSPTPPDESSPVVKHDHSSKSQPVNMDAIQKALNFINACDKTNNDESKSVSYRYEDFVGPASSSSDYYNPEDIWEKSSTDESVSSKDVDLRQKVDVDLRNFVPLNHSPFSRPLSGDTPYPPTPRLQGSLAQLAPKFSNDSSTSNAPWLDSQNRQRSFIPSTSAAYEIKDVDMRNVSMGANQRISTGKPNNPSVPIPSVPKEEQRNDLMSKEQFKNDATKNSEPQSKLEPLRAKVSQDRDKLIKLGQKGVAATQLEMYKQRRERDQISLSNTSTSTSELHQKLSLTNKSSSVSVLDDLLPSHKSNEPSDYFFKRDKSNSFDRDKTSTEENRSFSSKVHNKMNLAKDSPMPNISSTSFQSVPKKLQGPDIHINRSDSSGSSKGFQKTESVIHKEKLGNRSSDKNELLISKTNKDKSVTAKEIHMSVDSDVHKSARPSEKRLNDSQSRLPRPDHHGIELRPDFTSRDPRLVDNNARNSKSESLVRDPRAVGNVIRNIRPDNLTRGPRVDVTSGDPELSDFPRISRPDYPLRNVRPDNLFGNPRSETMARGPRFMNTSLLEQEHKLSMLNRRDPRVNISNELMKLHRGAPTSLLPRDPRMLQNVRQPVQPSLHQFHQQLNMNPRMGLIGNQQRPLPHFRSTTPITPMIPVAPVPPTQFQPAVPKNSAIGQTFTCLMMQGLPHYTNSSHIFKFFAEYLLRDLCIELDQSYNCKGTAYIRFPNHLSANDALDKENGKFIDSFKIYLRICSIGILKQAKSVNELQNFDREKYLNIPPRPRGNGNPFYNPKPKSPPPPMEEEIPHASIISSHDQIDLKEDEKLKPGYSKLCGTNIDTVGSKYFHSFKIPKIKKPAIETEKSEDVRTGTDVKESKSSSKMLSTNEPSSKMNAPLVHLSTEEESQNASHQTKKNRRYRKIHVISDSEEEDSDISYSMKTSTKFEKSLPANVNENKAKKEIRSLSLDDSDTDAEVNNDLYKMSSEEKDKIFDSLFPAESSTTKVIKRRRKRGSRIAGEIPSKKRDSSENKDIVKPANIKKKRGRRRKGQIVDTPIENKKITRQKQVEIEEISRKKTLQITIPTPLKIIYSLVSEDKIHKRVVNISKTISSSPLPSENMSSFASSENLSTCTSVHSSQDLDDVLSGSEKDVAMGTVEIQTLGVFKKTRKRIRLTPIKSSKRFKRSINIWQKGYKRKLPISLQENVYFKKQCLSPNKIKKAEHVESTDNDSEKIDLTKRESVQPDSSKLISTEHDLKSFNSKDGDSTLVSKSLTIFDDTIIDDNEASDLTQITPSITDKEISIFNVLSELSSMQSEMGTATNTISMQGSKEEIIKEISDDILEAVKKFTSGEVCHSLDIVPQESAHTEKDAISNKTELKQLVTSPSKIAGAASDDDDDNLTVKVNELVASLDQSFVPDQNDDKLEESDIDLGNKSNFSVSNVPSISNNPVSHPTVDGIAEATPIPSSDEKEFNQVQSTESQNDFILKTLIQSSVDEDTSGNGAITKPVTSINQLEDSKVAASSKNVDPIIDKFSEDISLSHLDSSRKETCKIDNTFDHGPSANESNVLSREFATPKNPDLYIATDENSLDHQKLIKDYEYGRNYSPIMEHDEDLSRVHVEDQVQEIQNAVKSVVSGLDTEFSITNDSEDSHEISMKDKVDEKDCIESENEHLPQETEEYEKDDATKSGCLSVIIKEHEQSAEIKQSAQPLNEHDEQTIVDNSLPDVNNKEEYKHTERIQDIKDNECKQIIESKENQENSSNIDEKSAILTTENELSNITGDQLDKIDLVSNKTDNPNSNSSSSSLISYEKSDISEMEKEQVCVNTNQGAEFNHENNKSGPENRIEKRSSDRAKRKRSNFTNVISASHESSATSNPLTDTIVPLTVDIVPLESLSEQWIHSCSKTPNHEETKSSHSNSPNTEIEPQDEVVDDTISIGKGSIPDDNSVISTDSRDVITPEPTSQGTVKRSKKEKYSMPLLSGLMERRRITRGAMIVPEINENILWNDGGAVDLFQCDQCDYVGKLRVSHIINFHSEREVPCDIRKEDFNSVLRESVGPPEVSNPRAKLDISWIPNKFIFDREIECVMKKNCDYYSNNRLDLIYHLLEHKPEAITNVFHCRLCNFMCNDLIEFYEHVSSHTGEYKHTCNRCGHKCFSLEALTEHHKDYHINQSQDFKTEDMILIGNFPYVHLCKSCQFVQISKLKIEEHIRIKHNGRAECVRSNMSRMIVTHADRKKDDINDDGKGKISDSGIRETRSKNATSKVIRGVKTKRLRKGAKRFMKWSKRKKNLSKPTPKLLKDAQRLLKSIPKLPQSPTKLFTKNSTTEKVKDGKMHDKSGIVAKMINDEENSETKKVNEVKKNDADCRNVPIFLGLEESKSDYEKVEVKSSDVILNRRTTPKTASLRYSSNMKKMMSTLDAILKKVDNETDNSSSQNISDDVTSSQHVDVLSISPDKDKKRSPRKLGARLHRMQKENTDRKIDKNDDHNDQPKSPDGYLGEISQNLFKRVIENRESKPLVGIISKLKTNLAHDNLMQKVKEISDKPATPVPSFVNTDDSDSDSNNLVICEDDEFETKEPMKEKPPEVKSPAPITPKPGLLRVKTSSELFGTPPQGEDKSVAQNQSFKCKLRDCTFRGSSMSEINAHSFAIHFMFTCLFECNFVSVSDKLYDSHFIDQHKIWKMSCPFHCGGSMSVFLPSDLIRHLAKEHHLPPNPLKEKIPLTSPRKQSSSEASSSQIESDSDCSKSVDEKCTPESPENSDKVVSKSLATKEYPYPGAEILPLHPPTVPISQLFLKYQTHVVFNYYTTSKAPEVFKCMVSGCKYSGDSRELFQSHLGNHRVSEHRCCYCLLRFTSSKLLVEHIVVEHSHCPYQCKYCLYRVHSTVFLSVHLRKFHPEREPRYIKVLTLKSTLPPNPPIDNFVHPYKCTYGQCNFRSVDTDAFRNHIFSHGADCNMPCIFCETEIQVDKLTEHMTVHMMNEFQCPYCLFGEGEREKLLTHLVNCHPGRPGKVLLRRQVSSAVPSKNSSSSAPKTLTVSRSPNNLSATKITNTSTKSLSIIQSASSDVVPTSSGIQSSCSFTYCTTTTTTTTAVSSSVSPCRTESVDAAVSSSGLSSKMDSVAEPTSLSNHSSVSGFTSFEATEPSLDETGLTGSALYRCGNEKCEYAYSTQLLLKEHLQVCDFSRDSPLLRCYHCSKHFRHLSGLLDHIKVHGPKRYICGVEGCVYRCTLPHYFKNHMKQVHHHTNYKIVLKDFSNKNPETQEFIALLKDNSTSNIKEPHKKKRHEFGVDDVAKMPRPHVSYHELKCYHCTYATKVRLNLIKHLNRHKKYPNGIPSVGETDDGVKCIPAKSPINPVPRLDRKELMFDKMMNLAGSSFQNKKRMVESELRVKYPIPQDELNKMPCYVPEEKINSCGIDGCQYLSCDETMLKYHIQTLHSDIDLFACPHCPEALLTLETMGPHFKVHGESLFRCGWCPHLSTRKALIERHLIETHATQTSFSFCIRGSEDAEQIIEENSGASGPGSTSAAVPSNQEPQWQCGICPFKALIQSEIVNHTTLKHGIKSQYKCGYCQVRSSARTAFDAHFAAKHQDKDFRVLCMYYRLDSNDIEPLPQGGSASSHEPLWRRNDPDRRRQIRGILLEEEVDEQESGGILSVQPGDPKGEEFVCPKCHSFKTPCLGTFRSHLCKEANYQRFECAECGITNPLLPTLRRHYTKTHGSQFTQDCYTNLSIDSTLEAWVESIISHQQHLMKIWKENGGVGGSGESTSSKVTGKRQSIHSEGETVLASGVVLHQSGNEKGKFVCLECGIECRSASGLKSHNTSLHQAKFKCLLCPFSSNTELGIHNHRSMKHPKHCAKEAKKNSGSVAAASTESSSTPPSKSAQKNVRGRNFKCSQCPFQSFTSKGLNLHSRVHSTVPRNFLCEYCGMRFETQQDGNRHSSRKHSSLHSRIKFSPLEPLNTGLESASGEDEKADPNTSKLSSSDNVEPTVCYSCCHCNIKGPYPFVEEHMKAQHRDLPFLLRREEGKTMHLEVYQYKCGHCPSQSVSLIEAMDHWMKNHVTLDFRFTLTVVSSSLIKSESTEPTPDNVDDQENDLNTLFSTPESSGTVSLSSFTSQQTPKAETDSEFGSPRHPSDREAEISDSRNNESFSSDPMDPNTESESEVPSDIASASSDSHEQLFKCYYCKKISKKKSELNNHIRKVHKNKSVKIRPYVRDSSAFKFMFRCEYCDERGTAVRMNVHVPDAHPGLPVKFKKVRGSSSSRDKTYFRCEVCAHVVKALRSIKGHMIKMHPSNAGEFTRIQLESATGPPPAKCPIKCDYCGDTAPTIDEIKSHHTFLHSHLPLSFTNLRDEALISIHKPSGTASGSKSKEPLLIHSFPLPVMPTKLSTDSPVSSEEPSPIQGVNRLKNTARKSFPMPPKCPRKRQTATKSTSGRLSRLQLVHFAGSKAEDSGGESDKDDMEANRTSSYAPSETLHLDRDAIFASVNLFLDGAPTRLPLSKVASLINLNPRVVIRDCNKDRTPNLGLFQVNE